MFGKHDTMMYFLLYCIKVWLYPSYDV